MMRLLTPGYGGVLSPAEVAYIKAKLKENPALRRQWGFRSRRISDQAIRKVALEGADQALKSPQARLRGPETYLQKKGTDQR